MPQLCPSHTKVGISRQTEVEGWEGRGERDGSRLDTPLPPFSSLLTLTSSPLPTMLKILVFVVTSHAPDSIQLDIPAHPPPPAAQKRPPSPRGSPGIFWPGPQQGAWSRKALRTWGQPTEKWGPQSQPGEGKGLAGCFCRKYFCLLPGSWEQETRFLFSPSSLLYLSNADKNLWLLELVGGLSEIMQASI